MLNDTGFTDADEEKRRLHAQLCSHEPDAPEKRKNAKIV
jgi:hypothetical protein